MTDPRELSLWASGPQEQVRLRERVRELEALVLSHPSGAADMAFNPSPEVAAARDFGQQFGADRVVILFLKPDDTFGYASWGKTVGLCAEARSLGDVAYEAVEDHLQNRGT